jgi:glycosyltransferase involved in cell wall biosynthesis
MRLLCVDQFSSVGGGQRSLLDLLPAFSSCGWDLCVALPQDGPFADAIRRLGCPVELFNGGIYSSIRKPLGQMTRYALEIPAVLRYLGELVSRRAIDAIYVNGPRFLPAAAWIARSRNIPLVFHCHSRLRQSSAIRLLGYSLKLSQSRIVSCCRYAVEPLRRFVPPERISVVYNGLGVPKHSPLLLSSKLRRVGVIGRVESEKGQLEFVKAAKVVLNHYPDCKFLVVGAPLFSDKGYSNRVMAAAAKLPVEFIGWQDDISAILADLDLLVVPSTRFEATTRVIPEAYSAGVPVVAFPSGGIPEILEDGETGFLTTGMTVEALANRILSVLRMDRKRLLAVVRKARSAWEQHYTLSHYRQQMCETLQDATESFRSNQARRSWTVGLSDRTEDA